MVELMLDELAETGYIKIVEGKAYPQEKSRSLNCLLHKCIGNYFAGGTKRV